MQTMQGDDFGLDLLINPKLKTWDSSSIRSSSNGSKASKSLKDFVIDIEEKDVDDDGDESQVTESVYSIDSHKSKNNFENGKKYNAKSVSGKSDVSEVISVGSMVREHKNRSLSDEEVILMKKEILYQFERLEKKGVKLPRKFSLASDLEEMKLELDRIKKDRAIDSSIKLQRRIMMAGISGLEWINGKFDPVGVKLDGWSDSVYENIEDYDEIFEQLHDKYKGKATMAPELKLLMMLGGSAFMHHMTHSMFKTQLPGLDEILKQNPELARNLAEATSQHMNKSTQAQNNLFGSLGNMFMGGIFGGGNKQGSSGEQMKPQVSNIPTPPQRKMNGPSNVEDLLREIKGDNESISSDRIEMMSIVTESELADTNILDDNSSIQGIVSKKKTQKKKTNTLNLDI